MRTKRRRIQSKIILDKSAGYGRITVADAALAHPVERHLAKVEVASSSLVGRSKNLLPSAIGFFICGYGGIGRHAGFRFPWETVQVQVLLPAPHRISLRTTRKRQACKRLPFPHLYSAARPSPTGPAALSSDLDAGKQAAIRMLRFRRCACVAGRSAELKRERGLPKPVLYAFSALLQMRASG